MGTWGSNEGRAPEQAVVLDGEVVGGGHGDAVPECAREAVVQDRAREANVLEVPIPEPSSRSNRNADPMKELKMDI